MKIRLFVILCLVMAIGLFAGCSSKLSPSDQNDTFDQDKISMDTVEANSRFAFDIFRQLDKEDEDQGIFISPLSISTALTMTYQGARTTTKEAMAKTLGYTGIDDGRLNESYKSLLPYLRKLDKKAELIIGNSLWVREGEAIRADFLAANREIFDAYITPLDFSQENAADQINQWISVATKKKIDKLIDPPIPDNIVMYLINAIYFKGDWTKPFDKEHTFAAQFHSGDGSTHEVMMMSRNGKVEYGQGDYFKAVRLPYGSGKMSMYNILPNEAVSINDFIADLDSNHWKVIRDSISEIDDVQLQLPRFKLENGIKNLNDSLTAMGMGEAFSNIADFSGIRDDIWISRVLHKAIIEVNEEGSEAAAATVVETTKSSYVAEPLTFIADRPFVFIIADDETGTILFMGKLYDVK
ncbi:MAG: serpin family protein [Bacillota bacterium]